jgi:hypothetical protein
MIQHIRTSRRGPVGPTSRAAAAVAAEGWQFTLKGSPVMGIAGLWSEDKETGEYHRPHHIDLETGMYRGRQVLPPKNPY